MEYFSSTSQGPECTMLPVITDVQHKHVLEKSKYGYMYPQKKDKKVKFMTGGVGGVLTNYKARDWEYFDNDPSTVSSNKFFPVVPQDRFRSSSFHQGFNKDQL